MQNYIKLLQNKLYNYQSESADDLRRHNDFSQKIIDNQKQKLLQIEK